MIQKKDEYSQIKDEVLALYQDKLLPFAKYACVASEDNSIAETRLKNLDIQAQKIIKDKFTLMVAGEAKSGKSTFINAYLGVDILPMQVLQCTSSIVEIKHAPEMELTATFADGKKIVLKDSEKIKTFLSENATVDDRYREIPVSIINEEIIAKTRGVMPRKSDIDFLMAGISKDKPSGLSDDAYRAKVVEYIKEKKETWNSVISQIEIGCPIKEEAMRGITIVDSPGVGAEGHVGDVTYDYIANADAIIFLKSAQGQDLDTSSFKQFVTHKAIQKKSDVLFLALTRIAGEPEMNVVRVYEEAKKRFKGNIKEEQILTIDSKAQLFYNRVKDFSQEDIEDLISAEKKAGTLDGFIKGAWLDADFERDAFLNELTAMSHFQSVRDAFAKFARKAHYAQLRDFLGSMVAASEQIESILRKNIELYEKSIVNPEELDKEINEVTAQLASFQTKLNNTLERITGEYINDEYVDSNGEVKKGIIQEKADAVKERYLRAMDEINTQGEGRFQELQDLTFEQIEIFNSFQDQIRNEFLEKCDAELVFLNDKDNREKFIFTPEITPEMIEEIKEEEKANPNSYTTQDIKSGKSFRSVTKKVPKFSEDLWFSNVKESITERVDEIRAKLVNSLVLDVDAIRKAYRKELVKNIEDQKARLTQVQNDKRTNESKQEKIRNLTEVSKQSAPFIALAKAEKERVDRYVV